MDKEQKKPQEKQSQQETIDKAKKILADFSAMENVHDIIKGKVESGDISSSDAARMVRLIKVFEGNALQAKKGVLEFKKGKKNENEDVDMAIQEAHDFMVRLPTEIGDLGRQYLDTWNKTVYEKYLSINKMRIALLRREIEEKKKKGQNYDRTHAQDILKNM
ncbi:hypothetical protein KA057_02230 [Candidatus Gracilibacteria bacterium]|nr:hypothetical protein [Candidatus Gracilibacteria bacterium]